MATLEEFKALRAGSPLRCKPSWAAWSIRIPRLIQPHGEIAAEAGLSLTIDEVRGFLQKMDDEDEFDDIELDAVALAAIAGGRSSRAGRRAGGANNAGAVC